MKSRLALVLALAIGLPGAEEPWRKALPGYEFRFPQDYFNHPEFRTEWWYYTGNLWTEDGRRFGFELTFFRHGVQESVAPAESVWDARDVWLAHFALSDIKAGRFHHTERMNRAGPGIAGAGLGSGLVWNGNWQVKWNLDPKAPAGFALKQLRAIASDFAVDLELRSDKPPVIQGVNGVSQKAAGAGRASHYVSLTRLNAAGTITVEGRQFRVEGLAWMDHEFFTHSLEPNQAGWDWFSLQFQDGSELMLYRLRRIDGTVEPYSSGTWIDPAGNTRHLSLRDYSLEPGRTWTSPETGANYPIEWQIRVPPLGIELRLTTPLQQQELTGKTGAAPSYWEGAVDVQGVRNGTPFQGSGYLEMTGYAGRVRMGE